MRQFLLLAICLATDCAVVMGQNLVAFHSPIPIRAAYITSAATQSDGNIVLGGDIAYFGTTPVNNLIRIHPNGTLDDTFSFSYPGDYFVFDMALLNSGEIAVLMRDYLGYNTLIYSSARILKLNADGSIASQVSTVGDATTIAVQDDGKILVGSTLPRTIVRYNNDLTEDNTFNNAVSTNGWVTDIKVAGDKIFLAGLFDHVNGVIKNDVAKLNLDGSIDNSFDTGDGTTDAVFGITVAPDGKVYPAKTYINSFNGYSRHGNVRLNENGSVDETFEAILLNGGIGEPVITDDGIYMSAFMVRGDITKDFLFRLNDDGSLDESFEPVQIDDFGSYDLKIIPGGDQLIVNNSQLNGNVFGLSKVGNTGIYDESFVPEVSRVGTIRYGNRQGDKIIVAGDFVRIDGINTFGLARLNHDGTVDDAFRLKQNHGPVWQMKLLDSDNTLVSTHKEFFKVNAVGDIKPEFNWTPGGFLYQVIKFVMLGDGNIMVSDPNTLVRLNADGSVDGNFDLGHSSSATSMDFDMQGDNAIYATNFTELLGHQVNYLTRVTPQATIDNTFDTGSGPTGGSFGPFISLVKALDNNEILVGGYISEFDGHTISHDLVKLSPDGALDLTFNANQANAPAAENGAFFEPKVEQVGSKVYIRGIYSIYVVNTDGTVDENFSIPAAVDGISDILYISPESENGRVSSDDGFLLAFGSFKVEGSNTRVSLVEMTLDYSTVSGLEGHGDLQMKVYPRPTTGILNITPGDEKGDFHGAVYDLSGKKSMDVNFSAREDNEPVQLDVSQVSPGFYVLKVTSASDKTGYVKFARIP